MLPVNQRRLEKSLVAPLRDVDCERSIRLDGPHFAGFDSPLNPCTSGASVRVLPITSCPPNQNVSDLNRLPARLTVFREPDRCVSALGCVPGSAECSTVREEDDAR